MTAFKTYVILIFGISAVLYMFGYTSPFIQILTSTEGEIATNLLNQFILVFTSPTFLAILGVSAIASYFTGGSNFSVTYLIPILLLVAMMNFFVLPTSFILSMELDPVIKMIVGGFLNLFLALALLEFVRGG